MLVRSLEVRFTEQLQLLLADLPPGRRHLLVAVSGGLDSTLLLYLLHFRAGALDLKLTVGHFDHRMRPSSAADAAWVRGLCRAWSLPLVSEVASQALRNEAEARQARYAFLQERARRIGTQAIVTGHHADDQAETVLFRLLRGSGVAGLRGIPARTDSGLLRPLLPLWRSELESYARSRRLRWRLDPTNRDHGPARNRIRNRILPEIERFVAPGARRNLVALAELAQESEAGWEEVIAEPYARIVQREEEGFLLARAPLREYHPAIGVRIVRRVCRQLGIVPDRIGTRSALQFITDAPSGREMQLPGGVRMRTEFEHVRIGRAGRVPSDRVAHIEALEPGEIWRERVRLGGREWRIEIGCEEQEGAEQRPGDRIPARGLHFPLTLRARQPGDRYRTAGGTKSLKKLMIERRIPRSERARLPMLADRTGRVLWVAGIGPASGSPPEPGAPILRIAVYDDESYG